MPEQVAERAAGRAMTFGADAGAIYGAFLLLFAASAGALIWWNGAVGHFHGYIDSYAGDVRNAALAGALLFAVGVLARRRQRPLPRTVHGKAQSGALLVMAALVLAFGAWQIGVALWYDLTFIDEQHVGASFAVLGEWFGLFVCGPLGSVLAAVGWYARRR